MRRPTLRISLNANWQPLALYGGLLALFVGVLWWQLGSLTHGYSTQELATLRAGVGWRQILDSPINAPFEAAVRLLAYVHIDGLLAVRAIAAACGLGTLCCFYGLVRHWHGERTAILGTILFGTSAWFLHTARLGTPEVLLFGLLALVACYVWLLRTRSPWALLACFLLSAGLLYVPGMVWFIALGVVLQWKKIDQTFKHNLWIVTVGGLLWAAALVPLGWALYHSPELAKTLAGLPADGWPAPLAVLKHLGEVPLQLFWRGPAEPEHWLAHLPVLDAFSLAMLFLGGYLYLRHWGLPRVLLCLFVLLTGAALISLGGSVGLTLIVPFLYVIIAAGIGFMLDRWLTVFPRNVIAQSVGYGLVCLALLAVFGYSTRQYFAAWPNAPATKAVFTVRQP